MNPAPPSRSGKDYLLPFLIIVSIGVIAALLIRLWGLWGDDEGSGLALSGKAELSDIKGGVEVYLPAAQAWKITNDAASLSTDEGVQTDADGSATLTFDDGSVVSILGSSELKIDSLQNSLTKKEVQLSLARGSVGVVAGTMNADLSIANDFLRVSDAGGKFLISIDEKETLASAVEGGFTATILDNQNPKNPDLKNFVVESGETLEISERRVNLIRIGAEIDLIKSTPEEILSSEIYLALAEGIALPESEELAPAEEEKELNPDLVTTDAERDTLPAPLVITGNGNVKAVTDPVRVSGKVSPKIAKVEVAFEDAAAFALSRFEAGSGDWSYNAARDFSNLKVGINNYTVIGYDADGNKTPATNFQITFNPEGVPEEETPAEDEESESTPTIEETDGIPAVGGETFGLPVVSEPADGGTFTEAPIHFEGTVPAGTAEVLVNEYKLGSFTAGDTSWIYNADTKYENLEVGENEYEVVAVSETGDRSSVTIKITYTQEEVAEEE
jgi:hypothetical protein